MGLCFDSRQLMPSSQKNDIKQWAIAKIKSLVFFFVGGKRESTNIKSFSDEFNISAKEKCILFSAFSLSFSLLKVWTLDSDRNLSEKGFLYDIKPYKINMKR